jgi:hypothetical protein
MSDQRRHRWRSGRLISTPLGDNWAHTRTARDPSINNLPLETAPAVDTWIPPRRVIAAAILASWIAPQFGVVRVPVVIDSVEAVQEQVLQRPLHRVIRDSWVTEQFKPVTRPTPPSVFVTIAASDDPPFIRTPNPETRGWWKPQTLQPILTSVVLEDGAPAVEPDTPVALRNNYRADTTPKYFTYHTNVYIHVDELPVPFKRYDYSRKFKEWSVEWKAPRKTAGIPWNVDAVVADDPPPIRQSYQRLWESWKEPSYNVVKYNVVLEDGTPPGGLCIPVQILNGVSKANIHGVSVSGISLTPCGGGTYVVTEFNTVSDNRSDDTSYEGYEY